MQNGTKLYCMIPARWDLELIENKQTDKYLKTRTFATNNLIFDHLFL